MFSLKLARDLKVGDKLVVGNGSLASPAFVSLVSVVSPGSGNVFVKVEDLHHFLAIRPEAEVRVDVG